ncbi:SIS domain-containing protein [Tetragenococcus koreensis]|uniref:Arabinose 5-phosphate isomerase n=1 Tax=Tetragenococcus koreensis TaxID=290335 RepID=A0AAN4UCR0_9ENTE|nr:SIS domain-containing protein [Tetragenococcus koreensis]MDN6850949.1 SIS domain-containing protein [Staphylococcus equorum]MCF1617904.1 SIS domain-containing protein [Tetragenococcus koreensis]MCF1622697.1 SIS domain-containing protein [Tetragenococcus koreensis]MCF1627198.1 SIS domain-containing protein [Tetragenococcus koreensis]MCF1632656.1 SIS domain-containing protein [Tetragenococcus koreensis]
MKNEVDTYINTVNEEINNFLHSIDKASLEEAKQLILKAEKTKNRVHISGIGKPGHVSGYIASLFSSTGTPTYELDGTEAVHGSSGQVVSGDVVIAISNSGETKELKSTVKALKSNGAKIISVTGNPQSWLAKSGDVTLIAAVENEGDNLNKPPRTSILVETIILQILSILLQNENHLTAEQYVKWHPGGAIGKTLGQESIQ